MPELPGADLILAGCDDLSRRQETIAALLVSIGATRLRRIGYDVRDPFPNAERRLYDVLSRTDEASAHGRYNAFVRRLVSFERAAETARPRHASPAERERIQRLMEAFGRAVSAPVRIYFVGGTTAVLVGWRESTINVDFVMRPDNDALLRAIPELKEKLEINVELASPLEFIPVPTGWEERGTFIAQVDRVTVFHFDLYAQALAKVERGHEQDLADVRAMLERKLVEPARALEHFARIEPQLYRFPAIDPARFRRAAEEAFSPSGEETG